MCESFYDVPPPSNRISRRLLGASTPPAVVLQCARHREVRVPLHPTLAMRARLPQFLLVSSPIEV
eukprot:7117259-Lingulodinium_polyedra.AAC.1